MPARLPDRIAESTAYLRERCAVPPQVGIILGTGLGGVIGHMQISVIVSFEEIPHFTVPGIEHQEGRVLFGFLSGKPIVVVDGRFHFYEGFSLAQVTYPVRVIRALGAEILVVSNACGGISEHLPAGSAMLIEDHINLLGTSPLVGPNIDELGPRWPDMSEPYDLRLMALAEEVAAEAGLALPRGVYACMSGPQLETRAEYRMLRTLGADVVGLSTVPEVIVAIHAGMRVLGLSAITDECVPERLRPYGIEEIVANAQLVEPQLLRILSGVLARL